MKKIIVCLFVLFIIAVTAINVKNVLKSDLNTSKLTFESIEALTSGTESPPPSTTTKPYTCFSGGPGSKSCSVTFELAGGNASCSVECYEGYYACCNRADAKCQCRKNS